MKRGPRRIVALLTASATAILLASLLTGVAAAGKNAGANSTPGSIEICKAPDGGAAGQPFSFTISNSKATQTVPVTGGTCSSAVSLGAGSYSITEDLSSGLWSVASIAVEPTTAWVSETDKKGLVKVTVTAGQETQIAYTDTSAAATIKVCKYSQAPTLQGSQFSFAVGSQTVTAVAGKSMANAGCSGTLATQPGTKLTITENTPPGEQVLQATPGGAATNLTQKGSVVKVTAGVGPNVVYFDNEPNAPAQTGFVEICKDAYDQFVNGTFHFEVTDQTGIVDPTKGHNLDVHADGTTGEDILVGQCSGPIQVPSGSVLITETQTAATQVQSIWAVDPNTLGLTNLTNGTAVAVVPVSASTAGEVQIHFVNKTPTSTLKICKYLPTGSEALAGQTFSFSVTDDQFAPNTSYPVSIVASAGANGACKIVTDSYGRPVAFPVGSNASATESNSNPFIDAGSGAGMDDMETTTVSAGVNSIPFSNVALGQLEICKNMIGGDDSLGQLFSFNYVNTANPKIKNAKPITVAAGHCSLPQVVPAGTYQVSEDLSKLTVTLANGQKVPAFQFVASDARGPLGDNRCVPQQSTAPNQDILGVTLISTNCGNPLTVTVPYFSNTSDPTKFGETNVTFWNKQIRAQLKVCKLVTSDSTATLGGMTFTFNYGVNTKNGKTPTAVPGGGLTPGTCTGTFESIPVAVSDGKGGLAPATVDVQENSLPSTVFAPSNIGVTGGAQIASNITQGHIQFNPGPGVNVVTYTNTAKPAGQ